MSILAVLLVILFIYDLIKDYIREWSAFFDLLQGDIRSSAVKYMGFTRANILRGFSMLILFILIVILVPYLYTKTEVSLSSVPDNISKKYKEVVKN